jgi:hypothetical protein
MPCTLPHYTAPTVAGSKVPFRMLRTRTALLAVCASAFIACGGGGSNLAVDDPGGTDSPPTTPPVTGTPGDSTPPSQPGDSTPGSQPGDTTPGNPGPSLPPPGPVHHVGIPFGPAHMPSDQFTAYNATVYTATNVDTLRAVIVRANQTSQRLFINFTGNEVNLRDANGFAFDKWKARVDRFREVDLTPYISDGTIVAHFIIDEPQDPTNWNGHPVTQAQIEQMAAYSKQVWPTLTTMARSKLEYLRGGQYPHLDVVRIQYLARFGPIDDWISSSVSQAKALHLAMVGGLNALNGGGKDSGIPGQAEGKFAMNADELRTYGRRFMSEPYLCGFLLFQWEPGYMNRPDIKAALNDLAGYAAQLPNKACQP